MNAAYNVTITTAQKTIFQSLDYGNPNGFDLQGVTKFYIYNHDTTNFCLVKVSGFHDTTSHGPPGGSGEGTGFGESPTNDGWMIVPPGQPVVFSAPKDSPDSATAIRRVDVKASTGSIAISFGVVEHR
jgi:hypothetical protein